MSAAEKLRSLEQSVAAGGDFDSRPCDTAQNDAGWALTEALPQIAAVITAAEGVQKASYADAASLDALDAALDALDKAMS